MNIPNETELRSLQNLLQAASRVVAVTGAGVSAESGIPTFRDAENGLWSQFSPYELATPEAFVKDPELVWGWYEWRRQLVSKVKPNPGHCALSQMQDFFHFFRLVTQNVDDLHGRAGSQPVIHLHGEIMSPRCFSCGHPYAHGEAGNSVTEPLLRLPPPICIQCDGLIRPGVVWFGESLPEVAWSDAATAASQCEVLFCLGTSGLVQPAASLPEIARAGGATVIQVNPQETALDSVAHYNLRGNSGVLLPQLVDRLIKPY